jgi:DeoR/GlpR family transcriptional regulator of sugar metabolism
VGSPVRASYELVGPAAERMLEQYHPDLAFIGVDGLTAQEGCTTHDEMEAQTDRALIRSAARTVVLADAAKIGQITPSPPFARLQKSTTPEPMTASRPTPGTPLRPTT